MTIPEAAGKVGVSIVTMVRYCSDGLAGRKVGRVWELDEADVRTIREWRSKHKSGRPKRTE